MGHAKKSIGAALLLGSSAFAFEGVLQVRDAAVAGPGCLPGSSLLSFESAGEELGLLRLDLMDSRVESSRLRRIDRRACNVAIPVQVPEGKRIKVARSYIIGQTDVEAGASARLALEVFTPGARGEVLAKTVRADDEDRQHRLFLRAQDVLATGCGESTMLRLGSSVLASGSSYAQATASIDTVALILELEDCK